MHPRSFWWPVVTLSLALLGLAAASAQNWTAEELTGASAEPLTALAGTADVHSMFVPASKRRTLLYGFNGGIWYLDQGSTTWKLAKFDATQYFGLPTQLIQDPSNPERIIASGVTTTRPHDGPYESLDSGATWRAIQRAPDYIDLRSQRGISINPTNPLDVVAVHGFHITRSSDGGKTWAVVRDCRQVMLGRLTGNQICGSLAANSILTRAPSNPRILLTASQAFSASGTLFPTGVLRTEDGGANWRSVPLPTTTSSEGLVDGKSIAFAKSDPGTVFAATYDWQIFTIKIYKSTDNGATWSGVSSFVSGSGNRYPLWVDPTNSRHLLLSAGNLYRSTDGGNNWTNTGILPGVTDIQVDPDFGPSNQKVYLVAKSLKFIDSLDAWRTRGVQTVGTGLTGDESFNTVSIEPVTGNVLFASTNGGSNYYDFSTNRWSAYCGSARAARFGSQGSNAYYCYGGSPIALTRYTLPQRTPVAISGALAYYTTSDFNDMRGLFPDPQNPDRLIFDAVDQTLAAGLWVTDNARNTAPTWRNLFPRANYRVTVLRASPFDAATSWASMSGIEIQRTKNLTAQAPAWTKVALPTFWRTAYGVADLGNDSVYPGSHAIAFSSHQKGLLLIGLPDGSGFRSEDDGQSWTRLRFGKHSQVVGLAFHPTNPNLVIAVGNDVFLSDDAGRTWGRLQMNDARLFVGTEVAWKDDTTAIVGSLGQAALIVKVSPTVTPPLKNHTSLWWNPNESGWGININHQGDIIFATLFTYDTDGRPMWLVMSNGQKQPDGSFTGDLYRTTGSPFNATPFVPVTSANVTRVGNMRLAFQQDGSSAALNYSINGASVAKTIQKQVYDVSAATCRHSTKLDRSGVWNYQDLWWNPAESGWGINIAHQNERAFATLFTYDLNGRGVWYVLSDGPAQPDGSFYGPLYETTGPAFNAQPFQPIGPSNVKQVGFLRVRPTDGQNATLEYNVTINGRTYFVTKSITRQVFSTSVPVCN